MRRRGARPASFALALAFAFALLACGGEKGDRPVDESAVLGGEVAARVGSEVVPASLVARVAAAQKISPLEARRRLVDDAIAASAAKRRGLDREPPAEWLLTAARARMTSDRLFAEAKAKGPPTDDEVKALSAEHWRELDRPPSFVVVHAVARPPAGPDGEERAQALAAKIHDAVESATSADDFMAKARAVPHGDVAVVVERLAAFTAEGATIDGSGDLDPSFAAGASKLAHPGDTSGLVHSHAGWHVIRLVEILPEQRMPFEARRVALANEVYAIRARKALDAVLASRKSTRIEIVDSAEVLMRGVTVGEAAAAPPPDVGAASAHP